MVDWNEFGITVIERIPSGFGVYAKPTARDLERLERELGLRLPESYKSFLSTFGVGDLGAFFKVYGFAHANDTACLLSAGRRHRANLEYLAEPLDPADVARRLVVFCTTYGGDVIAWDIAREEDGEYSIVGLPRYNAAVIPLAVTFPVFVREVFDGSVLMALGFTNPLPCQQLFEPWCRQLAGSHSD